jgi:GTPase
MFVDELTIEAHAGRGGDGVVRGRQEKFVEHGGPAGGNGGHGGDVYMRAVRDMNLLARYTGEKAFKAPDGTPGEKLSRHGHRGEDLIIDVPVGARVTDLERKRVYTFETVGEMHKILKGGVGGLGNEYFKSSTNRSPDQAMKGRSGEKGIFKIELLLIVDVGIIGFPNAGKSTLLNALTRAKSRVGAYPFTTTEPYLGDFHGFVLADIPGLIEGASGGRGLGHKFLRHVEKTKMLMHCISLEEADPLQAYSVIQSELAAFDSTLTDKEELVVLTKSDLVEPGAVSHVVAAFEKKGCTVVVVSAQSGEGVENLSATLSKILQKNAQKTDQK